MPYQSDEDHDDYKAISKSTENRMDYLEYRVRRSISLTWMTAGVVALVLVVSFAAFQNYSLDRQAMIVDYRLERKVAEMNAVTERKVAEMKAVTESHMAELDEVRTRLVVLLDSNLGQFPVGTIVPILTVARAPAGWLPCDGRRIAVDEYPKLHEVLLKATDGAEDLRLPDLTGTFISNSGAGVESSRINRKVYWFIKAE